MAFTRRELAELLLAAGAAPGAVRGSIQDAMISAGTITAIALAEDCANLVAFSPAVPSERRRAVAQARPFVQLGALLPEPRRLAAELARIDRPEALALAAGAGFAQAAEQLLNALPDFCRICADVVLLKQRCARTAAVSEDDLLDLLRATRTRRMIELHTLIPDTTDASGWLERLFTWEQKQDEFLRQLAATWVSPPPAMHQLESQNFYSNRDPLIQLARAAAAGRVIAGSIISKLAAETSRASLYAKALAAGYRQAATA